MVGVIVIITEDAVPLAAVVGVAGSHSLVFAAEAADEIPPVFACVL